MDYENDAFIWENQSWANLSNDVPYISGGETVVVTTEDKEKEVKGKGKEKKRGRGGATPTTTAKKGKKAESSNNNNGEKKKKKTTTTEEEEAKKASRHAMHIWTEKRRRKKMRNLYGELHKSLPQLPSKANKSIIVGEAVKSIKTLESTLQKLQKHKLEKLHGVGPSNSNNSSPSLEPSVAATSTVALLSTRESFMADQVSSSVNNTTAAANTNNNNNGVNNPTETTAAPQLPPVMIQTWTSSNVVLNIFGNDAQFAVYAPKKDGLFAKICGAFEKHNLELISAHISSDAFRCVYTIQARVANGANDQFPENVTVEEIYKQAADDITLWVSSN